MQIFQIARRHIQPARIAIHFIKLDHGIGHIMAAPLAGLPEIVIGAVDKMCFHCGRKSLSLRQIAGITGDLIESDGHLKRRGGLVAQKALVDSAAAVDALPVQPGHGILNAGGSQPVVQP